MMQHISSIEKNHICPRYPPAILAFGPTIAHQIPSVFHADQRGMGEFSLTGAGARGRRREAPQFPSPQKSTLRRDMMKMRVP